MSIFPVAVVDVHPPNFTREYARGIGIVAGLSFGFPTLLLQLPHQLIGGVDVDDLGLVLAVDLGEQEAVIMRVVSGEKCGDGEGDDVPSHFGIPSFPLSEIIITYNLLQIK